MSDYENWKTSTKYYPHAFNQVVRDAWEHQQAKIEELEAKLAAAEAELARENQEQLAQDLLLHGASYSKNGQRIDPRNVYIQAPPAPEITDDMIDLFWRRYTVTEAVCPKKAFREAHAYMMKGGRK